MKSKKLKIGDWVVGIFYSFVARSISGAFVMGLLIFAKKVLLIPFSIEQLFHVVYPISMWLAVMISVRLIQWMFEIQHAQKVINWATALLIITFLGKIKDMMVPEHYVVWVIPIVVIVFYVSSRKYLKNNT